MKIRLQLGSVNAALKAKRALAARLVKGKVYKTRTAGGCIHGIELDEADLMKATLELDRLRLSFRREP